MKHIAAQERDIVIKMLHLAYLVQAETDYCVFIRYSGHVNNLEIEIAESKERWQNKVLQTDVYDAYSILVKDHPSWKASMLAKVAILERILRENEIPYEDCDVEEYLVEEYSF